MKGEQRDRQQQMIASPHSIAFSGYKDVLLTN